MNKEQLKIWFAGFYEGEGSISNDKYNRQRFRLSISQNDRTPLDIGQGIWGGSIKEITRKSPASDKICYGHEWRLGHVQSLVFLNDIKPYMIIPYKINQIQKCVDILNQPWEARFKCSFCDTTFSDVSGRRRHENNTHIKNGETHKCVYCEKSYLTIDSMKRHIRINHKDCLNDLKCKPITNNP